MKKDRTNLLFAMIGIGILTGILLPRWIWTNPGIRMELLNTNSLRSYITLEVDSRYLFFHILGKRVCVMLLLFFGTYTAAGFWVFAAFFLSMGISFGILLSLSVWQMGYFGIFFMLCALIPQWALYGIAGYRMTCFMEKRRMRTIICKENIVATYYRKTMLEFTIILAVTLTGCFTEAYMNPWILKNILNFYF
ncbi:MAG: hypothetical protein PHE06_06030 [Lachnospiraceae bacterium]|nr:hypothetical protein [Lachnospiraceae bacterium]